MTMSQQDRAAEREWLAESLAAVLDADPETVTKCRWANTDRDASWAGLMGLAGMSFTPADLRVDDVPALLVRLFDLAVEEAEWLEMLDADGGFAEEAEASDDVEDVDDDDEVECALSDDSQPVDDRTLDEAKWSLLVDSWWRAAPPFVTTTH